MCGTPGRRPAWWLIASMPAASRSGLKSCGGRLASSYPAATTTRSTSPAGTPSAGGGVGHWQGDRSQTTLWQIAHNKSETGHGTQKPVEAMLRPIENNSQAGDKVYEPFSGSGTTLIACEKSARTCYAMELNPAYVDLAVRRWQQFTGKRATLEATGTPFPAEAVDA